MPIVGQTALVFLVPEAEAPLSRVASTFPQLVRPGLPAHVTVLAPWIPLDEVDQKALVLCANLAASMPETTVSFNKIGMKPGFVYLDSDEASSIEAICDATKRTWPYLPPYAGKHKDVRPHITLALGDMRDGDQEVIADLVLPSLPIRSSFESLHVVSFNGSRWEGRYRFRCGAS